ncbi:extracellular solute-binding protein family 1 [Spirochaeta thermophila DSM 6578]|uniref:Extracellular solute-binding protein family 1 n=1 Tax=Winmispira thermophila (strain ATCC 700085 / DSM 6578 / Z-1203) TaxID=869211 RepID=G0GBK3_WINT7|nr:sugar ABC transporter substrate-binding protein [Spirochaeta thermophila]AEJ60362.1 extracellular solute-binding protein family 1 [Spirochaeta thermophila DSM 6578]
MKRCVLLSVLFLMAASFLWAGAQQEQGGGAGGQVTIRYTRWAGTQEAKDFQALVDTFMKAHPEIKVETEFLPWGAYWEKVRTTVVSGDAADVLSMSHQSSSPYVTKGAFLALDDLPGAKELLDEMQPGTRAAVVYQGKIYGMPIGVGVRALIYNKKLLDEAGVPYPDPEKPMTWDEFIRTYKVLTKKNAQGEIVQAAVHFHWLEMWQALVAQMGGKILDDDIRPTRVMLNSPEGIAALKLAKRAFQEELEPPYSTEWAGPWGTPDSAVATGKVAFMHTGGWGLPPLRDAGIDFGTAPLPYPAGKQRATRGYVNFLSIYRGSQKVDAAWTFVKWMCGEGQPEFAKTGDLPANAKYLEVVKKTAPDYMKAFFSDLPYVITGPMLPTDEFGSLLEATMTDFFQDRISAEEAVRIIEEEGNKIIKKIYG